MEGSTFRTPPMYKEYIIFYMIKKRNRPIVTNFSNLHLSVFSGI
jgi:hypothetical protein